MDRIGEFIKQNESFLTAVLSLVLVLFFAAFEKKRKLPLLSLLIALSALAAIFVYCFFPEIILFGIPFTVLAASYIVLAFFVNLITYAVLNSSFYRRMHLVKVAADSIGHKIYAYLDSHARLLDFTEEFANMLGLKKNKKKHYEEAVSKILVDSQEMGLNVFIHYIGTQEERDYRVALTLEDGRTLKMDLKKRKVISSGTLLGYVLLSFAGVRAGEGAEGATLNNYLNFLGEPIFYYDFRLRKYVLTREMMNLLGVSENVLGENNFLSIVVSEDMPLISKRDLGDKIQKIHYRLKTSKGDLWFEESNVNFEGQKYLIAHRTDFSNLKMNFLDQKSLLETARLVYERNNWLALALVKITNHQKIKQRVGRDAGDVIISRFFSRAGSELGLSSLKIYRLEESVFGLLIDKNDLYNSLLALLNKENNVFVKTEISFNEIQYQVESALGIIGSENAEDSRPETIIRGAYEALELAEDPKYARNYSLYVPKAKIDLDLDDMGIDLSDDFLDSILKE